MVWLGRTLPRVRELKQSLVALAVVLQRRTLPRVRELKLLAREAVDAPDAVAPFPGCVN